MPEAVYGSKTHMIRFYENQLKHFKKVGIGNRTRPELDQGVIVTPILIKATTKRLNQLLNKRIKLSNDTSLRVTKWRDKKKKIEQMWRLLDEYTGDNTIPQPELNGSLCKTDSTRGHDK